MDASQHLGVTTSHFLFAPPSQELSQKGGAGSILFFIKLIKYKINSKKTQRPTIDPQVRSLPASQPTWGSPMIEWILSGLACCGRCGLYRAPSYGVACIFYKLVLLKNIFFINWTF
jgi:hypothetical protein